MNKRKKDTRYLASVALMMAVVILLANTPLGMIQLPIIKATTVHIPVILGAILLGPWAGVILGAAFGICSLVSNTIAPTLTSFAFSPFLSVPIILCKYTLPNGFWTSSTRAASLPDAKMTPLSPTCPPDSA